MQVANLLFSCRGGCTVGLEQFDTHTKKMDFAVSGPMRVPGGAAEVQVHALIDTTAIEVIFGNRTAMVWTFHSEGASAYSAQTFGLNQSMVQVWELDDAENDTAGVEIEEQKVV